MKNNMTVNKHTIGKLLRSIKEEYPKGEKCPVVAISGGVDSIVLAELFRLSEVDYRLVHFHHDQGRHDDECAAMAKVYVYDKNLEHIFDEYRADGSLLSGPSGFESTARKNRYAVLSKFAKDHAIAGNGVIVTGHHLDDQLENIFMGISRGVPVDRVAMARRTIFSKANIEVHRPLLDLTRKDIISMATRWKLEWCEDVTNQDQAFERNFFRHSIIPLLNTRRNCHKSVPKSVPTPDTIVITHENNLLSETNHFL